jgi:hypothetical protein
MSRADMIMTIGAIVSVIGICLMLFGPKRDGGSFRFDKIEVSGGAGALLFVLGLLVALYPTWIDGGKDLGGCWIFCKEEQPRVFNFPDHDTRQGDGKSGAVLHAQLTLLPPDSKNPNGSWTASWMYTGSGGTQKGSQNIQFHFKGASNADLFTDVAALDRSGCHYGGGVRQDIGLRPLQQPFDRIKDVGMDTSITTGTTGPC